jgi:DNA polymerase-3 subunit beta
MHLQIEQQDLMAAIGRTAKAVAGKSALPVLANLHLDARDDQLAVSATNLHLGIRSTVACPVTEPGATTVDAKLLGDFVTGLAKDAAVTIQDGSRSRSTLAVVAGPAKGNINTMGADDFPAIPEFETGDRQITVESSMLARLIRATERHAATDDSRPVLAGILFDRSAGNAVAASADGFTLSVIEQPAGADAWIDAPLLIPAANARHIAAVATELGGSCTVTLKRNGGLILFGFDSVLVWSSLIEGTFPAYRQIVPRNQTYGVEIGASDLMDAIRRAQAFARDNNHVVRLEFQAGEQEFDPGVLRVRGIARERGDGETELEVAIAAPGLEPAPEIVRVPSLALDARYVLSAIQSIGGDRLRLGINGSNQAVTFRPVGDDLHTIVLMPMVITD